MFASPDFKKKIDQQGYVFVSGRELLGTTLTVASQIGEILHISGMDDVQVLRPRHKHEAPDNIYSGNFGYSQFPLHTDLAHWSKPPRFLLLRSDRPDSSTTTTIWDSRCVISEFGKRGLERTLVQPRRPQRQNRPLLRVLEHLIDGELLFRWDRLFLVPATAASAETFEALKKYFDSVRHMTIKFEDPGDALLLDNHRILHGRSAVNPNSSRRIERVYMRKLK
jgi:L-asparagine oxygenase